MSKLRCLLADDEPIARQILEGYIQDVGSLELVRSCSNAMEVIDTLRTTSVDLLFLDINMPKLSGIELIKTLSDPVPSIIITTAYSNFAVEGFELSVDDYLLKPFSFERFIKAVMKVQVKNQSTEIVVEKAVSSGEKEFLFVKTDKKYVKLNFDEVFYIEAYGNYIKVFTDEMTLVPQTLSGFIDQLPARFLRTHKSFCVNTDKIKEIDGNQIQLSDGKTVPMSASYRKMVLEKIQGS